MELYPDFKEFLKLFNENDVQYMIVGAYALAHHGAPRYSGDIDIFVKTDSVNAQNIMNALLDFGFGNIGLDADTFKQPDHIIQLGVSPVRIDIITSISGVSWDEAINSCETGTLGELTVKYLGRKAFIKNKKASGRQKDLGDIEALGE